VPPIEEKVQGGLVLCRTAEHRLAFGAAQVGSIELTSSRRAPNARAAWKLPDAPGKVLISETGDGVTVDALEVFSDAVALMPPPGVMVGGAGGSLRGFVTINDELWPVLRLAEFSRFLKGLADG